MSNPSFRLLCALALVGACVLPSRSIAADDSPGTSDHDRVVAAALESASLRMRAKIEESALLDRQGHHDEALVALREVEGIHREGMALVRRLSAQSVSVQPKSGSREVLKTIQIGTGGRVALRIESQPSVVETPPAYIGEAVAYLMGMQRIDGWFRPNPVSESAPGADLDEGHDFHATALAVIALADALDDAAPYPRLENAVSAGVEALIRVQAASGAFDDGKADGKDLEAHALASWAVAAGTSHFPKSPWRPAARTALARAAEFTLAQRDDRGLWRAGSNVRDDDWILSAFMVASLRELEALPKSFSANVDLVGAFGRVQSAARSAVTAGTQGEGPAARFSEVLLANDPKLDASESLAATADGETTLLLGTTYRFGRSQDFPAWQDAVLAPQMQRQLHGGRLGGSWDPIDVRAKARGRTYATACQLLAALIPVAPFRDSTGD